MQSLTGQCFCSEVQFEVSAPESAPPTHELYTLTAVIWPSQLTFVQGEKALHTLTWGEGASWQECRRCRTRLFYREIPGEKVYIQLGAIRDRFRCRNLKLPDWLPVGPAPGRLVRQFHRAARLGRFSKMRRLLADGVLVDAEVQGQTALELASYAGRLRICRLLLSHGADVRRALRHAWQHLSVDRTRPLLRLLLNYGYPAQDLLPLAIDSGSVSALALVLEQSVDLHQPDDRGKTLLERAANSSAMIRLLLRAGVDVSLVGEQGTHALGWCSYFGLDGRVRILLEAGFPPDLAEYGSPGASLRYACKRGHVETARLLLQFGANPNLAEEGKTPLMLASAQGSPAVVELLLAAGADTTATDARGRTAIDRAKSFLPDLLSVAEKRARGWPGDGPVRHRWQRNSAGETCLKVWKDGRSWRWADGHAAIVHRLDASAPEPAARVRANAPPREGAFPFEGGCSCGGLRFRLHAPTEPGTVPTILSKRRMVGVKESQLEIVSGADSLYLLLPDKQSSNWWRCKKCRKSEVIFQTPESPDCRYVRLKSLDDSEGARGLHRASPDRLYLSARFRARQEALHWAANAGDTGRVKRMIGRGWPVDVEVDGWTPLQRASNSGYFRTARFLLSQGADARKAIILDGHSSADELPGWLATLIRHGYEPQKILGQVVEGGTPASLRVLLRAGADLMQPDYEGVHALLLASHNSCAMIRFVMKSGVNPTVQSNGLHALGFCAIFGFWGRARTLLECGFPVNLCEEWCTGSALMSACDGKHPRTARVLLEHGADVNLGRSGFTPLMNAARKGCLPLVNLLLEYRADPGLKDQEGRTALDYTELPGGMASPEEYQSVRERLTQFQTGAP